ncbi:hypothetical protein MMC07_008222 [Pseudocyphellaria aurata]|nr:hypothetical protein [Pseudocyphellaria aurata]
MARWLDVIKAILNDVKLLSLEKLKNKPIEKDAQVLALLKLRHKHSKAAAVEFRAANRDDLSKIEESQIAILQEYINMVPTASDDEIKSLVAEIIGNRIRDLLTVNNDNVIKDLLRALDGKQVDMAIATRTVRDMVYDHTKPQSTQAPSPRLSFEESG